MKNCMTMILPSIRLSVAAMFCFTVSAAVFSRAGETAPAVKFTIEPCHPWTPPFGVERVGCQDAVVEVPNGAKPTDEYVVVSYRDGKEIGRHRVKFLGTFGRVVLAGCPTEAALFMKREGQAAPVEIARAKVALPSSFEADAAARPDKIINPVDLGAILPPADWLLLAGEQKAKVEVAALSRDCDIAGATATAWYESASEKKMQAALALSQARKAQVKLALGPCSTTLKQDTLHVAVADGAGKELWRKDIRVMIVPEPPKWPSFGAVETKLRYDAGIPAPDGKTIDYNEGWDPKFQDLVVFLPNGARFVFWRGSSYCPFWAGRDNTGFSYEFAERGFPPPGGEAMWDFELRYGRVEIVESTAARVHVRWHAKPVLGGHGTTNGDFFVEDFYFYPDGFGTRVHTLTCMAQAFYELNEFIPLTPVNGLPFEMLPEDMLDMLWIDGDKAEFRFPYFASEQESQRAKVRARTHEVPNSSGVQYVPTVRWNAPLEAKPLYRIRIDRSKGLSVIQYSPWGGGPTSPDDFAPDVFGPQCQRGEAITPSFWANCWPLSRSGGGPSPAHNSFLSSGLTVTEIAPEPTPIRRERLWIRNGLGQLKPMRQDTFVWLIGMSDAGDDQLRQWAQSFAHPPGIEVRGAELDHSYYAQERRAMCLTMDDASRSVEIKITPAGRCVNPVFEVKNAPKEIKRVSLAGQELDSKRYAWDGQTLWLNARLSQPTELRLEF